MARNQLHLTAHGLATDNMLEKLRKNHQDFVGLDRMLGRFFQDTGTVLNPHAYPPYDVEKMDDLNYRISVAVAGFQEENVTINLEDGMLIITGEQPKSEDDDNKVYLHKGIAERNFERRFALAENVIVKNAVMDNGMLSVDLEIVIPEEKKPKNIKINSKSKK